MPVPTTTETSPAWKAGLQLFRWPNLVIVLFTQGVCYWVFVRSAWKEIVMEGYLFLLCLVLMTISAAAAGYVVNDILDRSVDQLNARGNVINTGRVSLNRAWGAYGILVSCGAVFSIGLATWSVHYLWTYVWVTLMLWIYSKFLKHLPFLGNLAVSCFCAGVIFIVWFPVFPLSQLPSEMLWLMVFAFLITLIREIVKDMEDIHGDRLVGDKTLPIILGTDVAKALVILLLIISIAGLLYPDIQASHSRFISRVFWMGTMVILTLTTLQFALKAKESSGYHTTSLLLKFSMLTGTLFLVL